MATDGRTPPKMRSDEERLAALRRVQRDAQTPDGFDLDEVVRESVGRFWESRSLLINLFFDLVRDTHCRDSWRERRRIKKHTKTLRSNQEHVRQCRRCRERLDAFMERLQRDVAEWKLS